MNWLRVIVLFLSTWCSIWCQTYTINTVAGGGLPVNVPGTSANLDFPNGLAVDQHGNVFVALAEYSIVVRLDPNTGILTRVAGTGTPGFSADNGSATSSQLTLGSLGGLAVDAADNLYISEGAYNRVRKVSNGFITTVAGNGGAPGFGGDNGPATSAQLNGPTYVAVDSSGGLYIADSENRRVRKVSGGMITTVAGGGSSLGDGGPATGAQLSSPGGMAVDSSGALYIADQLNNRVRKVVNGVITTVACNGTAGFGGDNGPATSALCSPSNVAVDSTGSLYIADSGNGRVRKVSNGVITTMAGGGSSLGDNGPATSSQLTMGNLFVVVDANSTLYISDTFERRVRRVSNGIITTVVGGGGSIGDGGQANGAQLDLPGGVAVDSTGNLYIADSQNNRLRKVGNGVISTAAGNGSAGFSGDNGSASNAQLNVPYGSAVDSSGNIYIADGLNARVRKVSNGVITTLVGDGNSFCDNCPTAMAKLGTPSAVAVDSSGGIYIADSINNRVRKVTNGTITTVAGNGVQGFGGDNGPATNAQLFNPDGIALDTAGNLYIADTQNNRIRKVSNGVITTVAGGGTAYGDFGLATDAQLRGPAGVAVDSAGSLYIADTEDDRLRKVANGVITTVAGNGGQGFGGDNGPAINAELFRPVGIALDSAGNVYVADTDNHRIRMLSPSPCNYAVSPTTFQPSAAGATIMSSIQTVAGCPWTVTGLPFWITLSSPPSGYGPASYALIVAPGNGPPRSAQILIAGITVTVNQAGLLINTGGVVNGAGYTAPVAPGSITAIFGNFLLSGPVSVTSFPIPTALGGLSFQFGGTPLAPLFYANVGQANIQVPWELSGQSQTTLIAAINGQTSAAMTVNLARYSPGIFAVNGGGTGQGAILDSNYHVVDVTNPATAGSTVVQMYLFTASDLHVSAARGA